MIKKAIVKLIEKWAYRCEHDWELVTKSKHYNERSLSHDMLTHVDYHYRCTKCCEHKKIIT